MDIRYFDAHTHVQFAAFDEDREAAFARSREAGVGMNLVGTQKDTSQAAIDCANAHDGVWATIGLHPIHTSKSHHDKKELGEGGKAFTSRGEDFDFTLYETMARQEKVIAIGECGLDYYRLDEESKKRQMEAFVAQIEVANTVGKPLMLHIRSGAHGEVGNSAYEDALELLKAHAKVQGDVHFFAGSWTTAQKFLDLGFTLSFTGVITFAKDYEEVVRNTPLDMILSETDAPYVTPAPHRGKRNEPMYIPDIVRKIAEIKNIDEQEAREALLANARRVFTLQI
jgi:TatD DNase family protein